MIARHSLAWTLGLVAVLGACGSDGETSTDDGDPQGAPRMDGGVDHDSEHGDHDGGTAAQHDLDGGERTFDAATLCRPLDLGAPIVSATFGTGEPPPPEGGELLSGVYHLTSWQVLVRPDLTPDQAERCNTYRNSQEQAVRVIERDSERGGQYTEQYTHRADYLMIERGTYAIEAETLALMSSGRCEQAAMFLPDGGIGEIRSRVSEGQESPPRAFTATPDALVETSPLVSDAQSVACYSVRTFTAIR